jgi:hypothetical protein
MVIISKTAAQRPACRSDAPDSMFELDASSVSGRAILARCAAQSRRKQQAVHHDKIGQRSDSIVKNLPLHSCSEPCDHRPILILDSRPGAFTEFVVIRPRKMGTSAGVPT